MALENEIGCWQQAGGFQEKSNALRYQNPNADKAHSGMRHVAIAAQT